MQIVTTTGQDRVPKHQESPTQNINENIAKVETSDSSMQVAAAIESNSLMGNMYGHKVNQVTTDERGQSLARSDADCQPSGVILAKQQEVDQDIGPVIRKLQHPEEKVDFTEKGERLWRVKKKLEVKEGLLVKYHKFGPGRKPIEQVVLPESLKEMVLESLHDSIMSGHFGIRKTVARVTLRYYWPGYLKDVEEWCRTCLVCQRRKNPHSRNIAPLQSIDTGQGPFEQIGLDILKLPVTSRKNQMCCCWKIIFLSGLKHSPFRER